MKSFLRISLLFGLSFNHLYGNENEYSHWSAKDVEPTTGELSAYEEHRYFNQDYNIEVPYGCDKQNGCEQTAETVDNLMSAAAVCGIGLAIVSTAAGITIWDKISHIIRKEQQAQARLNCLESAISDDGIVDAIRSIRNVIRNIQNVNLSPMNMNPVNIIAGDNQRAIVGILNTVNKCNSMIPASPRCPKMVDSNKCFNAKGQNSI